MSIACAGFAGLPMLVGCPQWVEDRFDTVGADAQSATQPFVAEAVPDDGARGVLPDAALALRFSTSMNTDSVEAAYTSTDIPPESVTFVWSETDRVLQIQPKVALRTVSGPAGGPAPVAYTFEISAAAEDAAGHAIEPKRISFFVARSITHNASAVSDRNLTGNWCSDGIYGITDCERIDQTICFGDSSRAGEPSYKGFVTFDLGSVPRDLIDFSAANLSIVVAQLFGAPFVELGALRAEHVAFAAIGDQAYAAPALSAQTMSAAAAVGDSVSADVLTAVLADWGMRDSSQFRLAFDVATDADVAADVIVCDVSSAKLQLRYWLP